MCLAVDRAFNATARSDVELVRLFYEPEVEVWMRGMSGVGLGGCYRGHEGVRSLHDDMDEVFADWSWTVRSVVDRGDRLAARADFVAYGRGSGVKTTLIDGGTAARFSSRGRIQWQEWFIEDNGWSKALEAL